MASTQSRPSEDIPSQIVTASIVWHGADSLIVCLRCALRSGKMRCAAVSCVFLTMCWLPLSQARGSSSSCNYKAYRYGKRMVGLPRPCKGPSRCPVFVRLESHRTLRNVRPAAGRPLGLTTCLAFFTCCRYQLTNATEDCHACNTYGCTWCWPKGR